MNISHDARSLLSLSVPPLLYWYAANKRSLPWREDPTPYHVWISEIMLQQTRVEAVKPYYARFLEACPDPAALAECSDDRLLKLWEGLGYYSRARNLKKAAQIVVTEHGGMLPDGFDALLSLPGIGAYTAGAIASIAQGHPIPAVDGNVLRVITRLLSIEEDITKETTKQAVFSILKDVYPSEPEEISAMTQALMELGALVCIPNGAPLCASCPLRGFCRACAENSTDRIPVKAKKKPRTIEPMTVLVLKHKDTYALRRREKKGLLAGMWELPNLPGQLDLRQISSHPLLASCKTVSSLGPAVHIFTHREWHMIGYTAECDLPLSEFEWKTARQIQTECAIASAFRAYAAEITEKKTINPKSNRKGE